MSPSQGIPEGLRGADESRPQVTAWWMMACFELLALRWRDLDLEWGVLRVTQTVYEGHFGAPKSPRSRRSVPLAGKSIEILSACKLAGVNLEALVFSTGRGAPFDRHNLNALCN